MLCVVTGVGSLIHIFSLGYIIVLCLMMYSNKLFLKISEARTKLLPILRNFVLPYMIFEMLISMVY